MSTARLCECGCGASLDGRRPAARFLDDTHRKRAERRSRGAAATSQPAAARPARVELLPGQMTRDEAERRQAQADAELSELKLERERGKWVKAEDVERDLARRNVTLRELVLVVDTDAEVKLHPSMSLDEVRAWYAARHVAALEAAAAHEEGEDDDDEE